MKQDNVMSMGISHSRKYWIKLTWNTGIHL